MGITLANFQLKAIEALMEAMGEPNRDIILKSCTGSGKTIILTHFMNNSRSSMKTEMTRTTTPLKVRLCREKISCLQSKEPKQCQSSS